jgi:hypothetical protein
MQEEEIPWVSKDIHDAVMLMRGDNVEFLEVVLGHQHCRHDSSYWDF